MRNSFHHVSLSVLRSVSSSSSSSFSVVNIEGRTVEDINDENRRSLNATGVIYKCADRYQLFIKIKYRLRDNNKRSVGRRFVGMFKSLHVAEFAQNIVLECLHSNRCSFAVAKETALQAVKNKNKKERDKQPKPKKRKQSQKRKVLDYNSYSQASWIERYKELCTYHEKHGNCNVPQCYEQNPSLGYWVTNNKKILSRYINKNTTNSILNINDVYEKRITLLKNIDFVFSTPHDMTWEKHYNELTEFHNAHGHTNVPQAYVTSRKCKLGLWVANQRHQYKSYIAGIAVTSISDFDDDCDVSSLVPTTSSTSGALTSYRVHKLNELNFTWNSHQKSWYGRLEQLKLFYEQNGHIDIRLNATNAKDVELLLLNSWLRKQRHKYNLTVRRNLNNPADPNNNINIYNLANEDNSNSNFDQINHREYPPKGYSWLTTKQIQDMQTCVPNFSWKARARKGPTKEEWKSMMLDIQKKISATPAKKHWFEGQSILDSEHLDTGDKLWTDQELKDLWNSEED